MQSMWVSLKSGSWLTPERLRLYPALLLDFEAVAVLVLVVTSDGRHDFIDRPLGTDFAQVWVAGTEVLGGHPAQPFDVQAHLGAQRVFFGPATDVYGWHYPPYFLALGALLALLPYGAALAVCVAKLSYIPLGPIVMLTLFALIIGRAMQARSDIRAASTSLAAIRSN